MIMTVCRGTAGPKIARAAVSKITRKRKTRRQVIGGREIKGKLYSLHAMNRPLLSVRSTSASGLISIISADIYA
jgi:hypothetical protein